MTTNCGTRGATSTPATSSSLLASKPPYELHAKHCWIYVAGHRNRGASRPRSPVPVAASSSPPGTTAFVQKRQRRRSAKRLLPRAAAVLHGPPRRWLRQAPPLSRLDRERSRAHVVRGKSSRELPMPARLITGPLAASPPMSRRHRTGCVSAASAVKPPVLRSAAESAVVPCWPAVRVALSDRPCRHAQSPRGIACHENVRRGLVG